MLRRFLLVGVAVVVPPGPGSLTQLVAGSSVALVYLVIQVFARPYKTLSDDSVALVSSFSLVTLFLR